MENEFVYEYASFGKRLVAFLIDGVIVSAASMMVFFLTMGTNVLRIFMDDPNFAHFNGDDMLSVVFSAVAASFLILVGVILYYSLQESSSHMATIGKRAMGIKVTDKNGYRISFPRAVGRTLGKYISGCIMYIGYIMAAFTERKQALHDLIVETYVIDEEDVIDTID